MLFSVLLPTHNRLEYLKYAIETVRRQNYASWEIIVSDNCSTHDIGAYVRSLEEPRIKYVRTSAFVPVTDNWNNALAHSSGDYVVMLGDDDGLLPDYFSTALRLFKKFPDPDFVYASAYFFAYPGVHPDAPDGFLRRDHSPALQAREPFWLGRDQAHQIAMDYLDFRMPVASNMQFSLISRRKIKDLSANGPFFRSPYPDFYATPMLFLTSSKILIHPVPMVIIGITPKSYGFFHFNNKAQDGTRVLNNEFSLSADAGTRDRRLPGSPYYDSWLLAMEAMQSSCRGQFDVAPNYRRYRFLQIVHVYKRHHLDKSLSRDNIERLRRLMRPAEKVFYGASLGLAFSIMSLMPKRPLQALVARLRPLIGQHSLGMSESDASFDDLLAVYEAHQHGRIRTAR